MISQHSSTLIILLKSIAQEAPEYFQDEDELNNDAILPQGQAALEEVQPQSPDSDDNVEQEDSLEVTGADEEAEVSIK